MCCIEEKLGTLIGSDAMDRLFQQKLDEFYNKPEGMACLIGLIRIDISRTCNITGLWLTMSGVTREQVSPMIRPFLLGISAEVAPEVCCSAVGQLDWIACLLSLWLCCYCLVAS
jgi:hypothetical protein